MRFIVVQCQLYTCIHSPSPYLRIQSTKKILRIQHVGQSRPLLSKQEHLFFGYKPTLNTLILGSDQPIWVLKPPKTQNPKYNMRKNRMQKFQHNISLYEHNKCNRNTILKGKKLLLNTLNGFAYLITVGEWLMSSLNASFPIFKNFWTFHGYELWMLANL